MDTKNFSIGMDLGVYAFCFIMAKQTTPWQPKQFESFADAVAVNIEKQTGTPAEDIALHVIPIMERAMKKAGGKP